MILFPMVPLLTGLSLGKVPCRLSSSFSCVGILLVAVRTPVVRMREILCGSILVAKIFSKHAMVSIGAGCSSVCFMLFTKNSSGGV